MKDEDKTKAELLKELEILRKEREKGAFRDIAECKRVEQAIRESEKRFRELFNHINSGVTIYEAKDNGKDFIIKDLNRAGEEIERVKKEDIIGKSVLNVFPGVKNFGLFRVFKEVYQTGKHQHHPISFYQGKRISGWRENYVCKLPSGEIVAIYDDTTERKQVEEKLKDSEEYLKILFDYAPDAYYINDLRGNFIDGNKAAERLTGYKREELIGKSFLKLKLLSLIDLPKAAKALAKNLIGQPTGPDEFVLNRKDNSQVTVEIYTHPVKIKGNTLVLGIARDITERKQMEHKLEEMATHDFLTGLPNRVLLLDRFTIAKSLAHRNKSKFAVMSFDLDKFKSINDTLGHEVGDQVLKIISTRFSGIIRASDTLSRIGGDEFLLLMLETRHVEDAAAVAQKILDSFTESLLIDGHHIHLSTSIGIAIYPEDGEDLETLTRKSDAAMYYSKGHGRNQFKFFGDGDVRIGGDQKSAT